MKRVVYILASLAAGAWPGRVGGAPPQTVADLLHRIEACAGQISYQGVKHIQESSGDTLRTITHHVIFHPPDRAWIQILAPEKRAGDIICRRGQDVYVRRRGDTLFRKRESGDQRPSPGGAYQPVELLQQNYEVSLRDTMSLLQRQVQVVEAMPRQGRGPWVRAWVDRRTGLVVRFERYGRGDRLVYGFVFETLEIDAPVDPGLFDITVASQSEGDRSYQFFSSLRTLELAFGRPMMVPQVLPDGYVLRDMRLIRHRQRMIPHLVYWNGISSLSLFQGGGDREATQQYAASEIRISESGGTVTVRKRGNDCTAGLVGDLSREEMVRIFESLAFADGQARQ